jgi:hypothetical protein
MTLESARPHLAALATLAQKLNTETDKFTEELKAIEAKLQALSIGLDVTVERPIKDTDVHEEPGPDQKARRLDMAWRLGYGRAEQGWRILVRSYVREFDEDGYVLREALQDTTPLLQSSRELRLSAASRINDLLEMLVVTAKRDLESIKATKPKTVEVKLESQATKPKTVEVKLDTVK